MDMMTDTAATTDGGEPVPTTSQSEAALVDRLRQMVQDAPEHAMLVRQWQEIQKTLRPDRFNPADPLRGQRTRESRRPRDDMEVQTPLVARDVKMLLAMSVPEDHVASWRPAKRMPGPMQGTLATTVNDTRTKFAETLNLVQKAHLTEANWQEVIELWAQSGITNTIAWLKVTWSDGNHVSPSMVGTGIANDEAQQRSDLQGLIREYANGNFSESDHRYTRMRELAEALGDDRGDMHVSSRIVAEYVPLPNIRWDPRIRSHDQIMSARWIAQEGVLSKTELVAKYPLTPIGTDATGNPIYVGITSAEADALAGTEQSTSTGRANRDEVSFSRTGQTAAQTQAVLDPKMAQAYIPTVRIWEVWSREKQRVDVIIADNSGFNRRLATWVPEKTPEQWYPFIDMVLLPMEGEAAGASLAWWGKDPQNRINRKRTEQEKARRASLPRYGVDSSVANVNEVKSLSDKPPFSMFSLNLAGKNWEDCVKEFASKYDPTAFDPSPDMMELDQSMGINDATRGTLGRAEFASEVQASVQGLSSWTMHLQNRIRRAVKRAYRVVAELILQNMPPRMAAEIAGDGAVWPLVYDEEQAEAILRKINGQLMIEKGMLEFQASQSGMPPDPAMMQSYLDTKRSDAMRAAFGTEEPVTRRRLFQACQLSIDVAMDAQVDRAQRIGSMERLANVLLVLSQAAQAMDRPFNPDPILRTTSGIFGVQEDMEALFGPPLPMVPPPPEAASGAPGTTTPDDDDENNEDEPPDMASTPTQAQGIGPVPTLS